jgi:hypothetical protein
MLAGNEVRVLEVWPVDALPEAMPVGCRYRVVSRGGNATTFELSAPPEQLEVLSPTPVHNAAPAAGRPHRYVLRRSDSPASAAGRDEPAIETSGRFENGEYVVRVKLGEGWRGRVSLLFDRRGVKGQTILDGKPVVADTPHIQLPDAIGRVGAGQGLRAQASDWSLFGVEAPHGEHLLRWTPASPPPPPRTTKCLVIVEANRQMPPRHRLTVEHGAMPLPQGVLLPQNWTWEERFVETLELATETPGD